MEPNEFLGEDTESWINSQVLAPSQQPVYLMGPNYNSYSRRDSWLMNMTHILRELLLDHEAKILMEIDPSETVSNKKSDKVGSLVELMYTLLYRLPS